VRVETAAWHHQVEAVADLPNSVHTRGEYVALLSRLYELHSSLERELAAPRFHDAWRSVGVDISAHRRAHRLEADLMVLGATMPTGSRESTPLATFGHALGSLYVLEGSSLGGPTVARIVRATLGDVPTTFLTGEGRSRPPPWLAVCAAMACFDARGGDGDAVVSGACDSFAAFADHVGRAGPSRTAGTVAAT
jgi:heme oxygenase